MCTKVYSVPYEYRMTVGYEVGHTRKGLFKLKGSPYVVNEFQLLSSDKRAVVEGQREVCCQSGYVAQPQFEKSHFDQDQLIVLTELNETYNNSDQATRDKSRTMLIYIVRSINRTRMDY